MDYLKTFEKIIAELNTGINHLHFGPPVSHVYNPLEYARKNYLLYLSRYGRPPKEFVLVGMNPGPWGMAQTGVPFGEVAIVKNWLKINSAVAKPHDEHPKRPVDGFACKRSEVSGKRLWGWAQNKFKTPRAFFARFFIVNYCPLLFIESSGRNRTPNQLPKIERKPLVDACDRALRRNIEVLQPQFVIGIGQFAEQRARAALANLPLAVGSVTHPSPANPKANQNWEQLMDASLSSLRAAKQTHRR